jgi:dTDP-4-amino-4,6-dideoxygalactose transaminase
MEVPYVNLAAQHAPIKERLLEAVGKVMDHSRFVMGQEVSEFEERFAELCGVRYAVGVNSGTDALILALKSLGVGPGDEVITPPNSFVASASCIALLGARPVFVDIGDDYNIDPTLIEEAITPRTRAILPVHLTGRPADMDSIMAISDAHGLHVVEDCAQAVCAEYRGRRVGSFGTAGCFSLHPLKTLNACGDGGVLTTNDPGLYEDLIMLRNHGLRTRDECITWGYNSRLDTLQAAILLVKLDYLEDWTEGRRANARFYQERLSGLSQVRLPVDQPYEKAVYHTFVVQAKERDRLQAYLGERGIGTAVHYPVPIHLQDASASLGQRRSCFPVTEKQAKMILSLPVYPELDEWQLEMVVSAVSGFYRENEI